MPKKTIHEKLKQMSPSIGKENIDPDEIKQALPDVNDWIEKITRWETVFKSAPIGIAIAGPTGNFIEVNNYFHQMLGYTNTEIKKLTFMDITHPLDRALTDQMANEVRLGACDFYQTEKRYIKNDGMDVWSSMRATVIRDKSGNIKYWIGLMQDISERKRAEEELHRYRYIVSTSDDLMSLIDKDYVYQAVNDAYLCATLQKREDIIGQSVIELMGEALFYSTIKDNLDKCLAGEKINYESWFDFAGWGCKYMDVTYLPLIDERQKVAGIVICSKDITEKKKLEDQLFKSQKMEALGTLAGGIAHDFNNLLMGIQGRNSLMLADLDDSHPLFDHLKGIEAYVKSASNLTMQLLGFARSGKYEVLPTDLSELVDKSTKMFGRTKKELKIFKKFSHDLWSAEVDRGQIEQVLLNLYVNSWQAMPGGGELHIQTENVTIDENYVKPFRVKPGKYVKISVTDTSIGMDADTRQKIFDPFFTTKEMGRGTGLGLASAFGIIKNHDGFINVYSEKGKGTTFNIYLPASDKKQVKDISVAKNIIKGDETVLLVDDEDIIIEVGKKLLKKLGYTVLVARGGKEAIDFYHANKDEIDLVILDMIMPDKDGGDTYDRLKQINPGIRVLLSSGYSINGHAAEILSRGCNGFIQKPFNLIQLSEKIREVLDSKISEN
jgi:PAS domain S-box-containing protein